MFYFGKRATLFVLVRSIVYSYESQVSVRSRWCNGLARLHQRPCYLQGPGFKSHLRPVKFFTCNKVSPLSQSNPNAHICTVVQYEKCAFCRDIESPQ